MQSAYRWYHLTETVLEKVVWDITLAADSGDVSVLALLDLSAAFDTVDHSILIQRLHNSHHVKGTALCWFESYLHERYQAVTYARIAAPATMFAHDVPQESVLEPVQFILYNADISCILNGHQLMCICCADDTHVYIWKSARFRWSKPWVKTALAIATSTIGLQAIDYDSIRTRRKWCGVRRREEQVLLISHHSPLVTRQSLHQTSFVILECNFVWTFQLKII